MDIILSSVNLESGPTDFSTLLRSLKVKKIYHLPALRINTFRYFL